MINPKLLDIAQNLNLWSIGNGYNYDSEYGGDWYDFGAGNSSYQPIEANTTYTISYNITKQQFIKYYDSSKTFISDSGQYTASSKTFTTPSNCAFIKVVCVGAPTGVNIMLNKGSNALAYMPYIPTQIKRTFIANIGGSVTNYEIPSISNYDYIEISIWYSNGVFDVKQFPTLYAFSTGGYGFSLYNNYHPTITTNVRFIDATHITTIANASDSLVRIVGINSSTAWEQ